MNGLLFLLCCIEILGALLCGAQITTPPNLTDFSTESAQHETKISKTVASVDPPSPTTSVSTSMTTTQSTTIVSQSSKSPCTTPSPCSESITLDSIFYKKEFLPFFMVIGGLMIACTILLVSTLLLACKVCGLNRRIKALSSNADQISTSEYWLGTGKKDKNKSGAEPKETTVLMSEISQTQVEVGNGTAQEEGGKVNKDEQTGEDKKEEGDAASSEEPSDTPATSAEDSSSSKPQEEEPTKDVAASTSEGTEEAKEVV